MKGIINNFNLEQVKKINENRGSIEKFTSNFSVGDTVKVTYNISDLSVSRFQSFTGVVIAIKKSFKNYSCNFTIRKIGASSIGVERTFFLYSPLIKEINIVSLGVVRRAKLFYLRNLMGRAAKIKKRKSN